MEISMMGALTIKDEEDSVDDKIEQKVSATSPEKKENFIIDALRNKFALNWLRQ